MESTNRITLQTIADALGITRMTVSRAMNNSPESSQTTREKVQKLALELGYQPNIMARSLVHRRSRLIGVIVPDMANEYYSRIVKGFYTAARVKGYEIVLMVTYEKPKNEKMSLNYLAGLGVDGILVAHSGNGADLSAIERIKSQGTVVVFYDRPVESTVFSSVAIDDNALAKNIIKMFVRLGKKRIAYVGPLDKTLAAKMRYSGYQEALAIQGFNKNIVIPCKDNRLDAFAKVKKHLEIEHHIDSVFCYSDKIAYGTQKAFAEMRPDSFKNLPIVGIGDTINAMDQELPFILVKKPAHEIGRKAIELLLHEIENRSQEYMPTQFILKASVNSSSLTQRP